MSEVEVKIEETQNGENGQTETPAEETTEAPAEEPAAQEEPHKYADNAEYQKLIGLKMKQPVAELVVEIYESGLLTPEDLDERAVEIINTITAEQAKFIFNEIQSSQLFGVLTKSLYVTSLIRSFKDRIRQQGAANVLKGKLINGPEPSVVQAILDRTNYPFEVTIGQRKYGGPCADWDGPATGPAGQGHEVYVGHIPNDIYEDTLIPLFEQCGKLWDLRLMMDPVSGTTRGYAFVTYCSKEDAANAAKTYDGHEITPGKPLKVNVSIANTRLFLGNIPKTKTKEEIFEELKTHTDGATDVIVYSVTDNDKIKNRGFCFVDFIDHKTASDVKRKITQHKIKPFNVDVFVDWAEQQEEPDDETMSKVKVLYVRNVKESITEEKLTELFKEFGELERVKKVKDYAFIHFNERENCMKALEEWNGKELEGITVEASLAKPPQEKKKKPSYNQRGNRGGPNQGGFNNQQGWGQQRGGRGGNNNGGGHFGGHQGYYPNGYEMAAMAWGGGYGDMYGGYGAGYGYGDFGGNGGYGGYGGFGGGAPGGFRGGRGGPVPRGRGGARGSGTPNRRGRGKRPGDGRGGPASKRDSGRPDYSADVNMSSF
ncbi:unnamed protein product [Caenorhabditis angaria]|uniref:RRM domain-containing protein n=1 Tax=Caenorhabditis angaria TaxID=860376 RepID=A0A9P1I7S0_9PELO|nr:unnamed protein product [Caenorhabditis angaria]